MNQIDFSSSYTGTCETFSVNGKTLTYKAQASFLIDPEEDRRTRLVPFRRPLSRAVITPAVRTIITVGVLCSGVVTTPVWRTGARRVILSEYPRG